MHLDFAVGLIAAPIMAYIYWQVYLGNHDILTSPLWFPSNLFTIATVLNTMVLTADRFVAVVRPLHYSDSWFHCKSRSFALVLFVWGTSFGWSVLPPVMGLFGVQIQGTWYDCVIIYGLYGFPLCVILVLNSFMFVSVVCANYCEETTGDVFRSYNARWGVTIVIVSLILIASYLPNIIWWQLELLDVDTDFLEMSFATNTVQVFNSSANPVIYALRSRGFKTTMSKLIRRAKGIYKIRVKTNVTPDCEVQRVSRF